MKFLVIGDSCTDKFVYGKCERICPEAPVPVFTPIKATVNGGMAKNLQSNVVALGVSCDIICDENLMTKTRYVDNKTNHMLLRVDENNNSVNTFDCKKIDFANYDAVLISLDGRDGKSFLNNEDIRDICFNHSNVFMDCKSELTMDLPYNLRFLKINKYELEINDHLKHRICSSIDHKYKKQVIVTYGSKGCLFNDKMYTPPQISEVRDIVGAGDTFLAALAVSFVQNQDLEDRTNVAINFANECASQVVTKRGVATI